MGDEVDFSCLETMTAAMHFAPVALVILDRKRTLQRANKMAEAVLGLDASQCQGEQFVRWCAEESWISVYNHLERAAEAKWSLGGGTWNKPQAISVTLHTRPTGRAPPGKPFSASLSCSSCFVGIPGNSGEGMDVPQQEAWYIVTIVPSPGASSRTAHSSESSQKSVDGEVDGVEVSDDATLPMASVLRDALLDNIGYPVIALSSDGQTSVLNRAADLLLRSIADLGAPEINQKDGVLSPQTASTYSEGQVNLDWFFDQFTLCDADTWIQRHPTAYPLYKVAILGQRLKSDCVGALTKNGNNRKLIDCDGFPMYDGKGKFIGGMLLMRDATDRLQKVATTRAPERPLRQAGDVDLQHNIFSDVGSQATHSDRLSSVEDNFRVCLQHLGMPAYTATPEGKLTWFNDHWYDHFGGSRQDSIDKAWAHLHPDDFQYTTEIFRIGITTSKGPFEIANRFADKLGRYRYILARVNPIRDSHGAVVMWVGIVTDVHDLATATSAHREVRDNLSDALRVADITLWSVDLEGVVTLAEGSLAAPSRQTDSQRGNDDLSNRSSIIGRSIYDLWGPEQRIPIGKAILAGEVVYEETTIQGRSYRTQYRPRRGKSTVSVSFDGPRAAKEGQILGVTGLSFDITERLQMERKFEESTREVAKAESASQAAEEASRMKSQFLAVISHEIRTPLNGVIGLSELLLDIDSLSEEARGLVQSILRSSGALLTVINDVLDFSKVDAGKLDLTSSPMSLRTVCQDAIWTYRRIWASKGLAFDVDIEQLPSEMVLGDAGRLTQVFNNLFGNAGKFTEEGTISFVALKTPSSDPSAQPRYLFTITDTGCGIPKDQQKMLFQPFRQADPSTSRRFGGSGLGLAICKTLVELMGGTIRLESEENIGTKIHVDIPFTLCAPGTEFDEGHDPAYTDVTSHPSSVAPPSPLKQKVPVQRPQCKSKCQCLPVSGTSKGYILLAEDNEINAQIAAKTLHKLGYEVSCAENGLEVLELLEKESEEKPYSLLLLDVMMPHCDGYTCSRRIRTSNNERHRNLPIIAATAAVVGGRELCLAAGMTDFLSKPMRRAALDAMLTKWVGKTHEDVQEVGVDQ